MLSFVPKQHKHMEVQLPKQKNCISSILVIRIRSIEIDAYVQRTMIKFLSSILPPREQGRRRSWKF